LIAENQYLRAGDIAICLSSGSSQVVGKTAYCPNDTQSSVGAFCGIIRSGKAIDNRYLSYWLHSEDYRAWRDSQARGANIQNIRFSEIARIEIPLPPLSEQKRIAAILNDQIAAVEKARAAAEAQLETARALPATYLRQVFPKEGQALPSGWRWAKLRDVLQITARQVDPKNCSYSELPHVSAEDIEAGTGRLYNVASAAEDGMLSGKYLFEAGCVLYSKIRPYLQKVALAPFRGLCSADMYPLDINTEVAIPQFLLWLLLSQPFTEYADEESRRARMPKLNRDQLFSYLAPIPPLCEQKRIANILKDQLASAERLRRDIEKQIREINAFPQALLRQAFRGEL